MSPPPLKSPHPVTRLGGTVPPCVSPAGKQGPSVASGLEWPSGRVVFSYGPWQLFQVVSTKPSSANVLGFVTLLQGVKWPISNWVPTFTCSAAQLTAFCGREVLNSG